MRYSRCGDSPEIFQHLQRGFEFRRRGDVSRLRSWEVPVCCWGWTAGFELGEVGFYALDDAEVVGVYYWLWGEEGRLHSEVVETPGDEVHGAAFGGGVESEEGGEAGGLVEVCVEVEAVGDFGGGVGAEVFFAGGGGEEHAGGCGFGGWRFWGV